MDSFKTLKYRDSNKFLSGRYAIIMDNYEIGDSSVPELLSKDATMKVIKNLYPNINFNDIELISVKLTEE